jgi:hypothetical protein
MHPTFYVYCLSCDPSSPQGINVYTHGEMLPGHGYPELHKYPHLVGNYGGAWYRQRRDFAEFPGPILMTTNCVVDPPQSYAGEPDGQSMLLGAFLQRVLRTWFRFGEMLQVVAGASVCLSNQRRIQTLQPSSNMVARDVSVWSFGQEY